MPRTVDSSKKPSKVAVRLPDSVGKTTTPSSAVIPHLLVHEGMRQSLERRLSQGHEGPAVLSITDNRGTVLMKDVRKGVLYVRMHFMFLGADPKVTSALVDYIIHDNPDSSLIVDGFIDQNFCKYIRKRRRKLVTDGKFHDLRKIYDEVNAKYFNGTCTAKITWSPKSTCPVKLPRREIRLGQYSYIERLITIHPLLDRAWIPRYFVAAVIHHEMLHHMIPSARGYPSVNLKTPRVLHPPEFREAEKTFKQYQKAFAWEQKNVHRLLRAK